RRDLRAEGEIPVVRQEQIDLWLEEHRVDRGPRRIAGERPQVVHLCAHLPPRSGKDGRRRGADLPLPGAQARRRRRRKLKQGTEGPDERLRAGRREKQRRLDVADAEGVTLARLGAGLVDEREDGSIEQGPRAEMNRHSGLEIEDVLRVSIRSCPEVEVGLCLHTDLVCEGIAGVLDELVGVRLLLRQRPSLHQGKQRKSQQQDGAREGPRSSDLKDASDPQSRSRLRYLQGRIARALPPSPLAPASLSWQGAPAADCKRKRVGTLPVYSVARSRANRD